MDLYNYNLVQATTRIYEVVDHLLSAQNKHYLPKSLQRELEAWRTGDGEDVTCDGVKVISFTLIKQIQQQLKEIPLNGQTTYIYELLEGSQIVFPKYHPPPRNPVLVARLEKIQSELENAEYNKMVYKSKGPPDTFQDIKLDVQATHRQLWIVVNFLFTVIGSFVFGYYAAYYAGMDTLTCVLMGLTFGLAVFFADLYFLLKHL